jgi:hypothetical protein
VEAAGSGSCLHVTVASGLAQNQGARTGLIVTEVVPFCFPLDKPSVSMDFLERRPLAPVSESDIDESDIDEPDIEESDIDAEEVNMEIYLCRDRAHSAREFFTKSLAFRHEILMPLLCLPYRPSRKLSAESGYVALRPRWTCPLGLLEGVPMFAAVVKPPALVKPGTSSGSPDERGGDALLALVMRGLRQPALKVYGED